MFATIDHAQGSCEIRINGERYFPMAFRSFWPQANTVKDFADQHFKLFSVFPTGVKNTLNEPYSQFGEVWIGEGAYCWDNLDQQIHLFLDQAPDAYFSLMVHLDTRDWFTEKHFPCPDSFYHLIQTAGYEEWILQAERFMLDMIDYIDEKYPDRMYGVFLFAGFTCEWFTGYQTKDQTHNALHTEGYRKFTGDPNASVPSPEELIHTDNGEFRDPVAQKKALDYWIFHNEQVAETICRFASKVKEHTNRSRLVGLFYGYLNGLGNDVLWRGHNALRRIVQCPDIDLLFAPAIYGLRTAASTSGAYIPQESMKLHGKLYFHEIDNTTYLVNDTSCGKRLQKAGHRRLGDLRETVMYFRRENAVALTHNQGCWWFDMFSGWYDSPTLMNEIGKIKSVNQTMGSKDMTSVASVAVFTDQTSNYYLNIEKQTNHDLVTCQIEQLNRMGTPWDSYLTDDIAEMHFPHDRYCFYIFLNLFCPTEGITAKIKELQKAGKSMLFLYAPGYITPEGFSPEHMTELTGLSFTYSGLETVRNITMNDGASFGFSQPVSPSFTAFGGENLGVYQDTAVSAFILKKYDHHFIAWSGAGAVPWTILKDLAAKAGAFIYAEAGDPLYMNSSLLGIYSHHAASRKIHLPRQATLSSLYDAENYTGSDLEIAFDEDEMKLFEILK